MLPNRPSPRNGAGLPTAPRSRSIGRSRQDEQPSRDRSETSERTSGSSSSRSVRPQRSMASMSTRDRSDAPPMPQSRQTSRSNNWAREVPGRKESDASTSSAASSLFDRLRGTIDSSARTSLDEDDYEAPKRGRGQDSRPSRQDSRQSYEEDEYDEPKDTTGVGYTLWGRLASAAGTLGVDVSKAWASSVPVYAGEETPPGQESRLTKAMKAYHLEKARDPSDLPEWLFEEHERRPAGRSRLASRQNSRQEDDYGDSQDSSPAPRSRGLQDIYNKGASNSSASPSRTPGRTDRSANNRIADESATASKATNRLQALRAAKRQNSRYDEEPVVEDERRAAEIPDRKAPPRMGLPAGPGGRPRRL